MRHHFHRCGHLRVLTLEAADRSGARKGGSWILEELCEAKRLARCVGLADCDVLTPAQKRDLLAVRATRLRGEEGTPSPLADVPAPRAAALATLHEELAEELAGIVAENRRLHLEWAAALQRNPRPVARGEEGDLAAGGMSVYLDEVQRELRTARLDALERGLDAMARPDFGVCVRCERPIELERLRLAPDTVVCTTCASEALPELPLAAPGERPVAGGRG